MREVCWILDPLGQALFPEIRMAENSEGTFLWSTGNVPVSVVTVIESSVDGVERVSLEFDVMTPDELETLANITTRVIGRLTESTEKISSRMT